MRLDVHLNNIPGAFQRGVTQVVSDNGSTFLCMEVLGTGDMGSLILLPTAGKADGLRGEVKAKPDVGAVADHKWYEGDLLQLGWISSLFSPDRTKLKPVKWSEDRRVLIRDSQITVPFGDFWHEYNEKRNHVPEAVNDKADKIMEPPYKYNYCLLARDMEVPILLALFPSRPLFRVDLDVSVEASLSGTRRPDIHQVGSGMLNEAVKELSSQHSNIWHVQNTYRSMLFEEGTYGARAIEQGKLPALRSVDSRISIVASVPEQRKYDRAEVIASYLGELRRRLLRLRLRPTGERQRNLDNGNQEKILKALDEAPAYIANEVSKRFMSLQEEVTEIRQRLQNHPAEEKISQAAIVKLLRRVVDEHVQGILSLMDPSFVKNVDIHGPPLFRCFFSHSARPAYDERDYIDRLKLLLESDVFEVIEGEFSLGMSTEALSRGRIRRCNLFVSFLWPRDNFRTDKGEYMPPEWVIHEESFAIGQSIPVYRIREQSVMPPRYEKDRVEFLFTKGDMDTWRTLERQFRLEIRQLVQQFFLGMRPTTLARDQELG